MDLDSHANIVVIGRYVIILADTRNNVKVKLFTPDYSLLHKIPTVDTTTEYNCCYLEETFILIIRNTFHILSINYNLISLLIMKEARLDMQTVLKIHTCNSIV